MTSYIRCLLCALSLYGSVFCTSCLLFFFFNDTATTEIYTLSLHDALPIFPLYLQERNAVIFFGMPPYTFWQKNPAVGRDRKSTRLNSSHANISYAVFCLKKKEESTHLTNLILDSAVFERHHHNNSLRPYSL